MNNDKKKRSLYLKYFKTQNELKNQLKNKELNFSDRYALQIKLERFSKNSKRTRIRNRCILTGRSKGVVGLFNISRIKVREMISKGVIPGVKKSSW
jgi:small subunit ribosomal protein S14